VKLNGLLRRACSTKEESVRLLARFEENAQFSAAD
jgi:hypothetical protein